MELKFLNPKQTSDISLKINNLDSFSTPFGFKCLGSSTGVLFLHFTLFFEH